jgi:hypothetical protein
MNAEPALSTGELAATLSMIYGIDWDEDVMRWEEPHLFTRRLASVKEQRDAER